MQRVSDVELRIHSTELEQSCSLCCMQQGKKGRKGKEGKEGRKERKKTKPGLLLSMLWTEGNIRGELSSVGSAPSLEGGESSSVGRGTDQGRGTLRFALPFPGGHKGSASFGPC